MLKRKNDRVTLHLAGTITSQYSLVPKMELPIRTMLLPQWIATEKSSDMPIDISENSGVCAK
jgi:hypothetical protein